MANKRILYAAEALFVGPSPATGAQATVNIEQIHRVQSVGYDFTRQLENVQVFGTFAPIDRIALTLPTISLNATYLTTNVANEDAIGLNIDGVQSALRDIINGSETEKNYYLRNVPDGNVAAGYTGTDGGVVAFGNGVLASYTTQGAVGGFPTSQFTVQALDVGWNATSSGFATPAIDPSNGLPISGLFVTLPTAVTGTAGQATALRPGDITVNINGAGFGVNNICIQNYNISFDLNLEPIICLGSKYPTSREIQFPIDCKFAVEANMRDLGTGRLGTLQCNDPKYDVSVTLREPRCDATLGPVAAGFTVRGATLESQSFNSTIGPAKTVTLNFTAPIGGPSETGVGLFMSGLNP